MVDDDEKREVAQLLRERNLAAGASELREARGLGTEEAAMRALWDNLVAILFAGDGRDGHSMQELGERLAELVEPALERTCEIEEHEGLYVCSTCGRIAQVFSRPSYCPHCGARVVDAR